MNTHTHTTVNSLHADYMLYTVHIFYFGLFELYTVYIRMSSLQSDPRAAHCMLAGCRLRTTGLKPPELLTSAKLSELCDLDSASISPTRLCWFSSTSEHIALILTSAPSAGLLFTAAFAARNCAERWKPLRSARAVLP